MLKLVTETCKAKIDRPKDEIMKLIIRIRAKDKPI